MLEIFAVLDKVAKAFMNPFYFHTKGEAHRSFGDAIKDEKTSLAAHPADYELYALGTFNPRDGRIECLKTPELVARGSDFIKSA